MRCPEVDASQRMVDEIEAARDNQDSIGGVVSCVCRGVPSGLGEPCFDKLEAKLAHAMLSIPATKGFEIGSGFYGTQIPGHIHNDPFIKKDGRLGTATNFSGGIQVLCLYSMRNVIFSGWHFEWRRCIFQGCFQATRDDWEESKHFNV